MIKKQGVAFVRPEVETLMPVYEQIEDCLIGQVAIKARRTRYLPQPNPTDTSVENTARYNSYLARAVFYNVTKKTLAGLVGFLFIRPPEVELPTGLQVLLEDATGAGVPLTQLAKDLAGHVLGGGRGGVLTDYPQTGGEVTAEDVANGVARPTLRAYTSANIPNWRTTTIGAKKVRTLVVLRELYDVETLDFEVKQAVQYRVLRRYGNGVTVELWRGGTERTGIGYTRVEGPMPILDHTGKPLTEIPFDFAGINDNDEMPDDPPLADIADLNIAHYRNSADYEETCYVVGQPTPWVSGISQDWAKNVLNNTMQLGSRAVIPLPVGGEAGLLQVTETTMAKEAMEHKEAQMIALGAKLIEDKQAQRTATEVDIQNVSESSALASTAQNVSKCLTSALTRAMAYTGDSGNVVYKLHDDLGLSTMSAEDRKQLIAEWQGGAITFGEMRAALRQVGVATEDDTKAKEQIDKEQTAALNLVAEAMPAGGQGAPNAA